MSQKVRLHRLSNSAIGPGPCQVPRSCDYVRHDRAYEIAARAIGRSTGMELGANRKRPIRQHCDRLRPAAAPERRKVECGVRNKRIRSTVHLIPSAAKPAPGAG